MSDPIIVTTWRMFSGRALSGEDMPVEIMLDAPTLTGLYRNDRTCWSALIAICEHESGEAAAD